MFLFKTIQSQGTAEIIIEKSRFIGHAKPVSCREDAEAFIAEIRKQYKDASHNVPAFVLGDKAQLQWASDDGEPQGTAGAPIVQMLVMQNITDVAVVVTRYFGGIKLGTGGLVRAYTNTAKAALEAGTICRVEEMAVLEVRMDYSYVDKLKNLAGLSGSTDELPWFEIKDLIYTEKVNALIACREEDCKQVKKVLMDLTGATYQLIFQSKEQFKVPVPSQ